MVSWREAILELPINVMRYQLRHLLGEKLSFTLE